MPSNQAALKEYHDKAPVFWPRHAVRCVGSTTPQSEGPDAHGVVAQQTAAVVKHACVKYVLSMQHRQIASEHAEQVKFDHLH